MATIKIDLSGDVFSCREYFNSDSDHGIEVKKGKKLIGTIQSLEIPDEEDEDYQIELAKFTKEVEILLDENYY